MKIIIFIQLLYFVSSLSDQTIILSNNFENISKYSKPIDINFMNEYSKSFWPISIIKNIYSTLKNIEFIHIIDIFNTNLLKFSNKFEDLCINLMEDIYEENIFYNFKNIDELTNLKNTETQKESIVKNTYNILITTASSILTGDTHTPLVIVGETAHKIHRYLYQHALQDIINTNKNMIAIMNSEKLYALSKIYCTNIATIKLEINNNKLYVVKNNIETNIITDFISILEKNIEHMLETTKNQNINIVSLSERLHVLKDIIQYIEDISNYMFYNYFHKIITSPTNINYNLKKYCIKCIDKLNNFVSLLQIKYPEQEIKINKTKECIENQHKIKMEEKNIEYLQELYKTYQTQIDNKISALKMNDSLFNFKFTSNEYIDYYAEKTKIYAFGFKNILKSLTKNILIVPSGIVEGTFELIISYMVSVFLSWRGIIIILLVAFILNFGQIFAFICRSLSKFE